MAEEPLPKLQQKARTYQELEDEDLKLWGKFSTEKTKEFQEAIEKFEETKWVPSSEVDGLRVALEKLEPTCELTDKEVNEFLAHEDDRGEIFQTGMEQGRLEIIKKVVDALCK